MPRAIVVEFFSGGGISAEFGNGQKESLAMAVHDGNLKCECHTNIPIPPTAANSTPGKAM